MNLTAIIITSLIFSLLIYIAFNLLKKNEKLEELVINQEDFIDKLKQVIQFGNNRLKEIDSRGVFKSDDEIGWFFNQIKHIDEMLSHFNPNINGPNQEEEEEKI